jgi:hypothetical protein
MREDANILFNGLVGVFKIASSSPSLIWRSIITSGLEYGICVEGGTYDSLPLRLGLSLRLIRPFLDGLGDGERGR